MIRLVPSRQPVDRSCCMSPPSLQEIKRMEAHISPVPASVSPIAAKINTVITKALEIGFESEMPSEIPLTRTNRKTSPTQTTKYRVGSPNTVCPTTTTAMPQNTTHETS